jgi:catecholate siderophore receptor
MPSGITALAHSRNRLAFAPTLLALAGVPLLAEDQPAPVPKPAPALIEVAPAPTPTEVIPAPAPTVTPAPAAEKLTVEGQQERDLKSDTVHATRLDLDLQHTPQSVTVINQDLLKTTGAFSLRDALRSAPGVTMAAGEGGRTGDSLVIRGFSANSDTYVDNLKDNGQYFRDTFNVQQVEVLKGASGLYFGRGVTGGAVNTVTKKPTKTWTGDGSVTVGTDEMYRVQAGVGGPVTEQIGGRLDAYFTDSQSFRDDQELQRWGIAPTVVIQLLPTTSITLQYMHQYEDSTMDYGVPVVNGRPADVPIDTYYGFADDSFQEYTVDMYTATIDHRFSENITLRNSTRYAEYERYYRAEPIGAVNPATNTFVITQGLRLNEQENLQNQTELAWNGTINERKLSVVMGLDLSKEEYAYRGTNGTASAPISVFDPQQPDHNPGSPSAILNPPTQRNHTDAETIGGYAMVAYEFIPSWTGVLGARFDRFTADYTSGPTVAAPVPVNLDNTSNMFNPRAGLVWDPIAEVSVYASYSTSSNPSAETYSLTALTDNLDPEENVNYEVGAKTQLFDQKLLLTAAVFRLEKTNARIPDPANTTVTILDGVTRTDGFELGAAGSIGKDWNLFAGYAYMQGEIEETSVAAQQGNASPNTPEHSGSIWLTYNIGWGFDVGAGMYAKSSSYTNAINTTTLPGYARFDVGAGWTGKTIYTRLNVFNVSDTVYYDAGSTNFIYPGAPLSGQITVGATF